MKRYLPQEIEKKWQNKWSEVGLYKSDLTNNKDKKYILVEFTYPSGDLHMGHWFTFAVPDILARFWRMRGYNVFLPNGFDAFGLPAENAAIKRDIHPKDWTYSNIQRMKDQFSTMGASYDWDHQVISCDTLYYKWNQWIFLKMYEKGLAYKDKFLSNWCPSCQTVLANEGVEAGKCWRCGTEVVQKEIEQWFLKITDYADKLLWQDPPQVAWPKPLIDGQNHWIGKSSGAELDFEVADSSDKIKVFTTRIDTIFGATFLVLAPEHPLALTISKEEDKDQVQEYISQAQKKSELERKENKEKTGVSTGAFAINPFNGVQIPIWVADYVLPGYGTGAIMAVPAHDVRDGEFASKYQIESAKVIEAKNMDEEGVLINSGEYTGLSSAEAREKMLAKAETEGFGKEKVNYHLHDWSFSRQRYWGTPIPIIYCDNCGIVPVPEKDLPVELPYKVDYAPQGKPPLATAEDWVHVKCPSCGGDARREVETMDTFIDSSWYFFRYLDPKNEQEIFDPQLIKSWMPVDVYFGGAEHTLGHALYSRFFTKFLHDLGLIDFDEYALRRVHHGVILGPDGSRMSKSKGNVVNPDEQVKLYGADAVRAYLAFLGPYDIVAPWNPDNLNGVYHFLERVWGLQEKIGQSELSTTDLKVMHKAIKKVGSDIESNKFNTALSALMEWLNHLSRKEIVSSEEYKTLLILLAPFTPHITEELWSMIGEEFSIHKQSWPEYKEEHLEDDQVTIAVQVNGKVRDTLLIGKDIVGNENDVVKRAMESQKVQRFIEDKEVKKTIYIPGKILSFVV